MSKQYSVGFPCERFLREVNCQELELFRVAFLQPTVGNVANLLQDAESEFEMEVEEEIKGLKCNSSIKSLIVKSIFKFYLQN